MTYWVLLTLTVVVVTTGLTLDGLWILVGAAAAALLWIVALLAGWLSAARGGDQPGPVVHYRTASTAQGFRFRTPLPGMTPSRSSASPSAIAVSPTITLASEATFPAPQLAGPSTAAGVTFTPMPPSRTPSQPAETCDRGSPEVRPLVPKPGPEHYERHAGQPGWLYVARNNQHREGLYKLGYTIAGAESRRTSLNDQADEAAEIGRFNLVHHVAVEDVVQAERRAFDLLDVRRVAMGRENFFGDKGLMIEAIEAAASCSPDPTVVFYAFKVRMGECPLDLTPSHFPPSVPAPGISAIGGWVVVARNDNHRPDLFRVGWTRHSAKDHIDRWNAPQRLRTTQIGFYRPVAVIESSNPEGVFARACAALDDLRLEPRRPFFLANLHRIVVELHHARNATSQQMLLAEVQSAREPISVFTVTELGEVDLRRRDYAPWCRACPECGVLLRFTAAIGAHGHAQCPACSVGLMCALTARQVEVRLAEG